MTVVFELKSFCSSNSKPDCIFDKIIPSIIRGKQNNCRGAIKTDLPVVFNDRLI